MPYLTWKSIDWKRDCLPVFNCLKDKRNAFFLDSSLRRSGSGRYSFLGFEPFYVLKAKAGANLFSDVRKLLGRYALGSRGRGLPFPCGAVGYFSYDLGLYLENIGSAQENDLGLPDVFLGFYDTIITLDHTAKKLFISSSGFPETNYLLAKKRAEHKLKQCLRYLSEIERHNTNEIARLPAGRLRSPGTRDDTDNLTSNFTRGEYLRAIGRAKEYIKKGDIYQVNLSQRFQAKTKASPPDLYARLRAASPSDFSAYLDCGDFQILSSSPERFLYFDGRKVISRPMKGTRPRARNPEGDRRNKRDLLKSAKDKAELLMIVDLLRNDLGRVCEYGSIKAMPLRALETYSTVYQTTAGIEGILHKGKDRLDLLKACFPGGSITGCPKIRSMQIIAELEPQRRGIYTGALGYFGFNNTMDFNILIRTILQKKDALYFHAGGGIVADSKPRAEYEETLVKARGMMRAIGADNIYENLS
jgi:para-aminobenzoate synthetase component 1